MLVPATQSQRRNSPRGTAQARNPQLECSSCGRKFNDAYDRRERASRDLPWSAFKTTVHIEVYRVKCPECGVKIEKVPLLPSKAPFSQRFEDAVGQAYESASARQVARRFGLASGMTGLYIATLSLIPSLGA